MPIAKVLTCLQCRIRRMHFGVKLLRADLTRKRLQVLLMRNFLLLIKCMQSKWNSTLDFELFLAHNNSTLICSDSGPSQYEEAYVALKAFINNALDTYRAELSALIYPFFVHSYIQLVYNHFEKEGEFYCKKKADCSSQRCFFRCIQRLNS